METSQVLMSVDSSGAATGMGFASQGADLNLSALWIYGDRACRETMRPAPPQRELFVRPAPSSDTVVVNDRVCFQTEEKQRVVFVHGVIFSHYAIEDRTAEAYAMVLLFESGYAAQNEIARCFGYSARSLRRYQERLKIRIEKAERQLI
jgi:hypothetical protein